MKKHEMGKEIARLRAEVRALEKSLAATARSAQDANERAHAEAEQARRYSEPRSRGEATTRTYRVPYWPAREAGVVVDIGPANGASTTRAVVLSVVHGDKAEVTVSTDPAVIDAVTGIAARVRKLERENRELAERLDEAREHADHADQSAAVLEAQVAELLPWAHAAAELFAEPVPSRISRHQGKASALLERIGAGEFGSAAQEVTV